MKINIVAPKNVEVNIRNCMPKSFVDIDKTWSINGSASQYDGVIVLQSTRGYELPDVYCRAGNSLLMIYEPQEILRLSSSYVKQFDHILTPNRKIKHRHAIYSCFGQLWTTDKSYDELRLMQFPAGKINTISAVISSKIMTHGHRKRLQFVQALKVELGEQFDWYGRGVCEIDDKWAAIYPYKYHLVFENSRWPDYWTEKLTDAFIGFSMPIYIGCTNLEDYFSPQSYLELNDSDPAVAAFQIKTAIENDLYGKAYKYLIEARNKILKKYSLFPLLSSFIDEYFVKESSEWKSLRYSKFRNTVHWYYPRKAMRKLRFKATNFFK